MKRQQLEEHQVWIYLGAILAGLAIGSGAPDLSGPATPELLHRRRKVSTASAVIGPTPGMDCSRRGILASFGDQVGVVRHPVSLRIARMRQAWNVGKTTAIKSIGLDRQNAETLRSKPGIHKTGFERLRTVRLILRLCGTPGQRITAV